MFDETVPITYRTYYKKLIEDYTQIKKDALEALDELKLNEKALHEEVKSGADRYKESFGIDLFEYEEFVNNEYKDGLFLRLAKGAFLNRKNNYLLVADLFDLYNLAKKQKEIYQLTLDIEKYSKILNLTLKEYKIILRTFYFEVHRQMITKGYGYVFEGEIGWTCINRCKVDRIKQHLDYAATKQKKAEILARGGRIYNKEEAEWAKNNNLPYDGEDCRVFQKVEAVYEIPLIGCKFKNGRRFKLEPADTRGSNIRGKSNDDLKAEANGDLEYICGLDLGLKAKLSICLDIDKTLYTNFIRNENQTSINAGKIGRKNRQ